MSDKEESNPFGVSSDDENIRRSRRHHRSWERSYNDLKVDIPEFKGQLDPNLTLHWLKIRERVFECKGISDDKKVKLVALKLRKYASI